MGFDVRLDGLTLSVASVRQSLDFYRDKLGFKVVVDSAPDFGMVRVGGPGGGTIGPLALKWAVGGKRKRVTPAVREGGHLENPLRLPEGVDDTGRRSEPEALRKRQGLGPNLERQRLPACREHERRVEKYAR